MAAVLPGSLQPLLNVAVARADAFSGRLRPPLAQQDSASLWHRRRENPFPFLFLAAVTSCSFASPTGPRGWGLNCRISRGGAAVSLGRYPFRLRGIVAAATSDDAGMGRDDGDEVEEEIGKEWEMELKKRLGEMEEMQELEKRAQELQSRVEREGGEGEEETEEEKRNRVRRELEKLAKEQKERRERARLMFELGQKAYGKGMYKKATEFLEGALTIIPRSTLIGGEVQIWLAMAYEANNRHKDCIELYQQLEKQHPIPSIRRQAAELRYILQAPKLKISKDEMVTIPLIGSSYDSYAGTWSDKYKDQEKRKMAGSSRSPPRDFWGDFISWRPPNEWEKSRAIWFSVTLWLALIGIVLLLQR